MSDALYLALRRVGGADPKMKMQWCLWELRVQGRGVKDANQLRLDRLCKYYRKGKIFYEELKKKGVMPGDDNGTSCSMPVLIPPS